jgi:1-deoxy-D-xylulose-5-phosphate reductoisomerase
MAKILILGSTGSIGTSACNCVRRFRGHFTVTGLAAGNNVGLLAEQIREFSPKSVYIANPQNATAIKEQFSNIAVYDGSGGANGLERIVNEADYDILLNALVGAVGFRPTVAALRRGKRVALANKESLVIGGDYIRDVMRSDSDNGGITYFDGRLLPVDSEHSAILQCLPSDGAGRDTIESIILTASGGPFRNLPKSEFASITPEQALNHPTWSMGKKITIDSSTLMNKGFELIEAHHLFALPYDRLRVCVHPQSIVHSLVEFHDGAVLAQLGLPDMELPIQYALSWPQRLPIGGKRLNLSDIRSLEFFEPDMERFPCLRLCIDAGKTGGTAPAVANAANEVAVELFLSKRTSFTGIAEIVESALNEHKPEKADSVEVIENADSETRRKIFDKYKGTSKNGHDVAGRHGIIFNRGINK